ncbi:hypothetical protein KAR91_75925 [Candidatus Pacearchaeota archaeon]|nr:hypothetical protein [Candidatus Pacearchaeota archaeon]
MKMRIVVGLFLCAIFLMQVASAEIIVNEEPNDLYNIGDVLNFPIKIAAAVDTNDFLSVNLLCNGMETEIYKEYISLKSGEETGVNPNIPLLIEGARKTGTCKIKTVLGESFILSPEFEISGVIIVKLIPGKNYFMPGEYMTLEGEATKKTGEPFNGFLKVELDDGDVDKKTTVLEVVKNGYFSVNFSIDEEKKAGKYLVRIEAYQKDSNDVTTNIGLIDHTIEIGQVPTNLEIILENEKVEPGTNLRAKAVLHDQSGESIKTNVVVTIRDSEGKLAEKNSTSTDEFFEFFIAKDEAPLSWEIGFETDDFYNSATFEIMEKADAKIDIVNKTVIVTNIGNVAYSKIMPIKIGNTTIEKNVSLDLGEEKKYILTAPEGIYNIEIYDGNESISSSGILLTGKAIGIEEAGAGVLSALRMSVIWIFVIAILGFMVVTIFKKGYEKTFFGYITRKKKKKVGETQSSKKLVTPKIPAELCLSIKGSKQNADIVCLKIKGSSDSGAINPRVEESLQEITDFADDLKAITYESNDNIIFILAPIKTKTFKNEKAAIKIAQKAKEILVRHNKLYKARMDLGISLNYGTIIAKQEKTLKFMSMGTLMGQAKKIAGTSKGRILLGEKINDRLSGFFKTKKQESDGVKFYVITDVKNTEDNQKFIDNFVKGLNKDQAAKKDAKKKAKK